MMPFFPGYLFVRTNLQHVSLSRINATPGVIRLVAFDDDPQPVPSDVIEMLYERLAHFDQARVQPFEAGDIVRVNKRALYKTWR